MNKINVYVFNRMYLVIYLSNKNTIQVLEETRLIDNTKWTKHICNLNANNVIIDNTLSYSKVKIKLRNYFIIKYSLIVLLWTILFILLMK